jgi:hypothetical protein
MAVEDFKAAEKGLKVEIVAADHQNKPDDADLDRRLRERRGHGGGAEGAGEQQPFQHRSTSLCAGSRRRAGGGAAAPIEEAGTAPRPAPQSPPTDIQTSAAASGFYLPVGCRPDAAALVWMSVGGLCGAGRGAVPASCAGPPAPAAARAEGPRPRSKKRARRRDRRRKARR